MAYKRTRREFEGDLQAQQSPYVLYGTPLPPLDPDVRDDGSYVPVWKQEVVDERGRKRLHGAFTGGFSAGYFNTVGSKEGWTPTTFVSSRTSRHKDGQKGVSQRPEDFMDEEDLAEQAEAQKLSTADSFAGLGSTDQDMQRKGLLRDVLRTSEGTMGAKLLQRMGWRPGQGVGPKIRRRARLDEEDKADQEEQDTYLLPPDNSSMISFVRKDDHKGLGYVGASALSSNNATHSPKMGGIGNDEDDESVSVTAPAAAKSTIKKSTNKGGFGVGILNDTGSDEEDPYEIGPRISYNRVIGGDKKTKKPRGAKLLQTAANPLLSAKPIFTPKKTAQSSSAGAFRKCHDGRLPLQGFVLSSSLDPMSASADPKKYAPPEIPRDWKSSKTPQGVPLNSNSTYQSTADAAKSSTHDPKSRAALLGEAALPGKSVFDYLSSTARERIASATGRTNLPPALGESAPAGFVRSEQDHEKELWNLLPALDKDVALAALGRGIGGWMPYAEDEEKRTRYRSFLELRAGLRNTMPERPLGMTKDAWVKELQEFARAAQVFKPMTGMMASRFTSSVAGPRLASDAPESTNQKDSEGVGALLSKPEAKPEDPAEAAAKLGMFGPMTRSVVQFFPTRLVCKRFNVKPPSHVQVDPGDAPGSEAPSSSAQPRSLGIVSKSSIDEMMREASVRTSIYGSDTAVNEAAPAAPPVQETRPDPEKNEALEAERAGEAVFKAIFGSDDEDEEE